MKNKKKFLFSIITPVKNGSKYIRRYIDCLYKQTYNHWEAIIIDDGSNDGSLSILRSLTLKDSRFKIIINKEKKILNTPYLSRNIGLNIAKGDYICFLDIDDLWLPNKLLRQFQILAQNQDLNLVFSSYYRFNESNRKCFIRRPFTYFGIKNIVNFINPVPMLSACVKTEKISNIRFKPQYHEDYLFWREFIKNNSSDSVYIDNELNTIYNISENSLSNNKIKVIKWIWDIYFFENKNFFLVLLKIFCRGFLQIIIYLLDKKINKNPQLLIK